MSEGKIYLLFIVKTPGSDFQNMKPWEIGERSRLLHLQKGIVRGLQIGGFYSDYGTRPGVKKLRRGVGAEEEVVAVMVIEQSEWIALGNEDLVKTIR